MSKRYQLLFSLIMICLHCVLHGWRVDISGLATAGTVYAFAGSLECVDTAV